MAAQQIIPKLEDLKVTILWFLWGGIQHSWCQPRRRSSQGWAVGIQFPGNSRGCWQAQFLAGCYLDVYPGSLRLCSGFLHGKPTSCQLLHRAAHNMATGSIRDNKCASKRGTPRWKLESLGTYSQKGHPLLPIVVSSGH